MVQTMASQGKLPNHCFSKSYRMVMKLSKYGCSFVAKLGWKKNFFWKKKIKKCVFYKIYIIWRKNAFISKKSSLLKNFLTEKNVIYREKYKSKIVIWEIYFYAENVCVTNKIQIFLKYILIFPLKNLIINNIFVKTSLWTQ